MKALYAAVVLLVLAGSAYAQGAINLAPGDRPRTAEEREKDRVAEEAYKAEMKKIPDQKASSDPWGNVRSTDTSKTAPAARKPKQQ
jgi:hypothetical protein